MRYLLAILFIFGMVHSYAQERTVYGVIKDESNHPVDGIQVLIKELPDSLSITDEQGRYKINVPDGKRYTLYITSIFYYDLTKTIKLGEGEQLPMDFVLPAKTMIIPDAVITEEKTRDGVSVFKIKPKQSLVDAGGGNIESYVVYQAPGVVTLGGELSSAYSVRGGSFDENLVYVNDFEVYRPYLIRSGQQEGLSFANPSMVDNIEFSSGGFEARYGDKMSSVLDITYLKPDKPGVNGSVALGLLGASAHIQGATNRDSLTNRGLTFILGARYKNSSYILNSLETSGEYSPRFIDFQGFVTYDFSPKLSLEVLANYAQNRFDFVPQDRQTTFGVVNQVLRLEVFFDGAESDAYQTLMSGVALKFNPNKRTQLKWGGAAYNMVEQERFDLIGEYFIGEVETDLGDENFGQVRFGLGTGTIHDWARNELTSTIYSGLHRGTHFSKNARHTWKWGVTYKHERIHDRINEWARIDSAGYATPFSTDAVLFRDEDILKSTARLSSNRFSGFFQDKFLFGDETEYNITFGTRFQYWDLNKEWLVTPRVQLSIDPKWESDMVFTGAAGLYYQPPFYREMRDFDGTINTNLRAQKSAHIVAGMDYNFEAWDRDFKFITEIYGKYMWDLVPYELDNVLIRYFGENNSKGYAVGVDLRLHGELVEDAESWVSLSVMQTQEDILDDFFYRYFNAEGEEVFLGQVSSDEITDTTTEFPGYIPRPTDQRVNVALFFQDYIPGNKNFKVHLNLLFGTGLPFGPPDRARYKDNLRIPPYRRVDIGFSVALFDKDNRKKELPQSFIKNFDSIWATLEIYNLLGINNTVSYLWVEDLRNTVYAVPNFLSARRINGRLIVKF